MVPYSVVKFSLYFSTLAMAHSAIAEGVCQSTTLSPSGVVKVCPEGQTVNFTCNTSQEILIWNIVALQLNNETITRQVGYTHSFNKTQIFDSLPFYVIRNSDDGDLPLVSTLSVTNVTAALNGTIVQCVDPATMCSINATMQVINLEQARFTSPEVESPTSISYESDNIIVTLNWVRVGGIAYHVSTAPLLDTNRVIFNNESSVTLTLQYNTSYNVSLVASLCDLQNISHFSLKYVTCVSPGTLVGNLVHTESSGVVPFREESTVTFNCPFGLALIGPNTSTCMENGEWKPDPRSVMCKADCGALVSSNIVYNSTLEGSLLMIWCPDNSTMIAMCDERGNWVPDPEDRDEICSGNNGGITITIATSVGVIFGVLIVVLSTVVIVVVSVKRKKFLTNKRGTNISRERPLVTEAGSHQLSIENASCGVYSLLQHSTSKPQANQTKNKESKGQGMNVVYADIGPISLKKQSCVLSYKFEDDRVDYVQVKPTCLTDAQGDSELLPVKLELVEPEKTATHPADESLNLDVLLIQLRAEATQKWYQLGEVLGVQQSVLDKCAHHPADQCIVEVLDNWLREHTGRPTWREVAEALRRVHLQSLALKVEKVYETGELPINFNTNEITDAFAESKDELPPPLPPKLFD